MPLALPSPSKLPRRSFLSARKSARCENPRQIWYLEFFGSEFNFIARLSSSLRHPRECFSLSPQPHGRGITPLGFDIDSPTSPGLSPFPSVLLRRHISLFQWQTTARTFTERPWNVARINVKSVFHDSPVAASSVSRRVAVFRVCRAKDVIILLF